MIYEPSVVETNTLGKNVTIHEFSVIRSGVVLGSNVIVHPHVVIEAGVTIGDNVEIFPGAYIGKQPKGAGATTRQISFDRQIVIGANSSIGPHAVIFYDVEIGESTLIGDGASIREGCRIGSKCIISRYVTINYSTRIGDRTKIMDLTHITGKCNIGKDVFISTMVGTTNDNAMGTRGYEEDNIVGPVIEDEVMVGVGASILPGVRIGKGSVVGAGSVVTKDVSANTLVLGIPARAIRQVNEVLR